MLGCVTRCSGFHQVVSEEHLIPSKVRTKTLKSVGGKQPTVRFCMLAGKTAASLSTFHCRLLNMLENICFLHASDVKSLADKHS